MKKSKQININSELIVKNVSSCNMRCDYCHWFRDSQISRFPSIMPVEVEDILFARVSDHVQKYSLDNMSIVLHGGEPLLAGKERILNFCQKAQKIEQEHGTKISINVTTNGTLLDHEWGRLADSHGLHFTISLDGPKEIHDKHRKLGKRSSFEETIAGIKSLKESSSNSFSILAVADPSTLPEAVVDCFVDELEITSFDILVPKWNHDDLKKGIVNISDYFIRLFDLWYDNYSRDGIKIRICSDIARLSLNLPPVAQTLVGGPMYHVSIAPNGEIEPIYNLRMNGADQVFTGLNIVSNSLESVISNKQWLKIFEMAQIIPEACTNCELVRVCKGGMFHTRYSSKDGYNRPSVYCSDIKKIISHAKKKISKDLIFAD
ncbi:radical SAM protein [Maridesulfovibrio sp.]|uniref:radical SAM protein n=1 Tax=Maridesulfovibrio sp. TaxID=2795000 RepID=UPI0039EFED6F